jgi:hypothetical protein
MLLQVQVRKREKAQLRDLEKGRIEGRREEIKESRPG